MTPRSGLIVARTLLSLGLGLGLILWFRYLEMMLVVVV